MAMTVISLIFGAGSGALVALLLKFPFAEPMRESFYEDAGAWNVPFDDEEAPEIEDQMHSDRDVIVAEVREGVAVCLVLCVCHVVVAES